MISSEFKGFSQFLADFTGLPQSVLIALAFTFGIGWICWRTRSTHVVIRHIWRLVFGRAALADREIASFIETRNRLVTFRFISGLPVRTLAQAKRLLRWSKANEEELATIKACGNLFDLENCCLREGQILSQWQQVLLVLFACVFGFAVAFFALGSLTDRAVLQFKESKTWFLLSTEAAVSFPETGRITKKACADSIGNPMASQPFSAVEATIICKALSDINIKNDIEQIVMQQRFAFGIVCVFLVFCAWTCWATFRCSYFASGIKQRLSKQLPTSKYQSKLV